MNQRKRQLDIDFNSFKPDMSQIDFTKSKYCQTTTVYVQNKPEKRRLRQVISEPDSSTRMQVQEIKKIASNSESLNRSPRKG